APDTAPGAASLPTSSAEPGGAPRDDPGNRGNPGNSSNSGNSGNSEAYAAGQPSVDEERHEPGGVTAGAQESAPAPEDSRPVPVVAPHAGAAPFEIDEVEALPDGVDDEHEGASDFVPVARPGHQGRGHRA
ncbi:MAG: hypothetical protein HOQ21_00025, partial [Dermatophilaceae bacterium]|nr:hypothetical protein [Dermatophilaceae bacterium]